MHSFVNPLNNQPVFMDERVTKDDKELVQYAHEKGLKFVTNNSKQLLIKGKDRTVLHDIVSKEDIEELSKNKT